MLKDFGSLPTLVYFKGGGSSGGGQSGKVDYPDYMKTFHGDILNHDGADTPTSSMMDLVNSALGNSPFSGETAYDPSTPLAAMDTAVCAFDTVVDALDNEDDWVSAMTAARNEFDNNVISDDDISAEVTAYGDILDDKRDNDVLPRFKGGMRDINAVMSSAFVIGEAVIEAFGQRDLAMFEGDLKVKAYLQRTELITKSAQAMLQYQLSRAELEKAVAHYKVEYNRLFIVASKEEADQQLSIDEQDAKWDMDAMLYAGNILASIAGASTVRDPSSSSGGGASVIGGALSGAAAGTMVSPGYGTLVGAVLGGVGALLS